MRGRRALQVWRPAASAASGVDDDDAYTLVGQTFVRLTELRFHEISLPASRRVRVSRGDVLGLYYPGSNPVGWSVVPCAGARQRYRFVSRSSLEPLIVGDTLRFHVTPAAHDACRQYSFAALFGNVLLLALSCCLRTESATEPFLLSISFLWSPYGIGQTIIFMVALCNRADHYIFILFVSSFFFFFFSSPNLSGRRLDVYHTLAHGVALVRI